MPPHGHFLSAPWRQFAVSRNAAAAPQLGSFLGTCLETHHHTPNLFILFSSAAIEIPDLLLGTGLAWTHNGRSLWRPSYAFSSHGHLLYRPALSGCETRSSHLNGFASYIDPARDLLHHSRRSSSTRPRLRLRQLRSDYCIFACEPITRFAGDIVSCAKILCGSSPDYSTPRSLFRLPFHWSILVSEGVLGSDQVCRLATRTSLLFCGLAVSLLTGAGI